MRGRKDKGRLLQKFSEEVMWLDSKYGHPPFYERMIREIPFPEFDEKDRIIDVGCGAGWLCKRIAKMIPKGEMVGIDISERYIEKLNWAKERDESGDYGNIVFRLASAEDIPYPDNYFDYAVSSASLSFWSQPQKGLKEIARVLKPGGKLYVIDVYKEGPRSYRALAQILVNLLSPYEEKFYSSQELHGFFANVGFSDIFQKDIMGMLLIAGTKESKDEGVSGTA
jgi:ubiquinone/menaquinone biosynthesis C-methylase UbiE